MKLLKAVKRGVGHVSPKLPFRRKRIVFVLPMLLVLLLLLLAILLRLLPKPSLSENFPSSRTVTAAHGELLRMSLASDEQYRLWTPLEQIAAPMQEAALLYEDRWFYWHIGFNPWSLLRASVATTTGKRRIGGSTISMQLARRVYQIDSRSVGGKLTQAAAAFWLELRYSKHDILEAYLNSAPYGGNVEGVGAASLTYWRKSVRDLSVPEALNLAVIPQNPRKRLVDNLRGTDSPPLQAARQRLARLWVARHPQDARFTDPTTLALPFQRRSSLPFLAPHAVDYLLRTSDQREVHSSLDLKAQTLLERVMVQYVNTRADQGIYNASALLLDASTMQVQAMVGSIDYHNEAIAGQVNGVFAKRSPGSTLKPFIYALALDQGLIHSASILKDAPSNFGAFAPENFDGRFSGPIPAYQALIRSRNIPAVDLASRLSKPTLYDFLKLGGVQKLESEAHYGLALALGGGEVTMEELAQLYATLLNQGNWQALRYLQAPANPHPINLISPEASFITIDMLRQTPRPDTFAPARPAIAWKTGTSWSFRDAWTAGVFGRYVLVVWVGNFNGASNPAFVGIEAAAPLFLRIVDALRAEKWDKGEIASVQPADLKKLDICVASGDLPNAECPVTAPAWFIAGKSPIRQSTLHRTVLVDSRTGRRACVASQYTHTEVVEYWSSDMLSLFKKAGMPLRQLPAGECSTDDANVSADAAPHITSPLRGVTHIQRAAHPEPIYLRADVGSSGGTLRWFVDDSLLGQAKPAEAIAWTPPHAGRFVLRVIDGNGLSDSRELVVDAAE